MTILEALSDPKLFGPWFSPREDWRAWRVFLGALFALPIADSDLELYRRHTGRTLPPTDPAREAWMIVGRRGGKSRIAALLALFLACFRDYSSVLAPGEHGTVMALAADRRQARTVLRYINGFLDGIPMLASRVVNRTKEGVELSGRVSIEVHTSSFRAVRGYTLLGAVLDEVAFWRSDDSANPDVEVVNALRPGMATVPGALLLGLSSPYSRRGVLWDAHREHFGKDGDVLVWQADTRAMNPAVPQAIIDRAYASDEAVARAEYGAEFRRDLETFLAREAVEAVVVPGRREIPWIATAGPYRAFVDPSGGSVDSMTLAIAHAEDERVVLDALREVRPPFSPEVVVGEFAQTLRAYRLSSVTGDRYAAEWVTERFRKAGIDYKRAEKPKTELYGDLLPAINSGGVELLDSARLVAQLCGLERRTSRAGRDSIDHAPGAHDDLANVVAGVCSLLLARRLGPTPESLYGPGGLFGQPRVGL